MDQPPHLYEGVVYMVKYVQPAILEGFIAMINRIVNFWRKRESDESGLEVQDLLKIIDKKRLPKHIAIIMDGNGRWAQRQGLLRTAGHRAGAETLRDIVELCCELGIQVLTIYAFSTENWKRPREEVIILMDLLVEYLNKEKKELNKKGVRVNPIGRLNELPQPARDALADAVKLTCENNRLILNIALNYGGRTEIIDAIRAIATGIETGRYKASQIDADLLSDHLYTAGQPEPDLLIRPSGDYRISNFLLWQMAYTEFWFTSTLWPEFRRYHLLCALVDYQRRERRFGGLKQNV
ncbi:MAG: Ditrans,polycis-undecaprenyl-diphosphate synthase ((2E,6E)-farnesyl-diphosphate specific) [Pelotomaculum sp. PtaB.Bin117]|nr:MAG: Ditrans,polycis-undecaprenyl-diphosphate synthase ((2E,6E)-farnesyl-diphosphate specific) [Pelotomaculum sp. PtaB.Bin117]